MSEGIRVRLSLPRGSFDLAVDLQLPGRGVTALFGPSGSGKTSVLRCVAGLERAPGGEVRVDGQAWQDDRAGVYLPTWRRSLGYVFQEASLFEHLDVRGNLAFGLKRARANPGVRALESAIALLGIGELLDRPVDGLSGGERQRVAIARALVTTPSLLLLDEPLASIDHARRLEILPWLERIRDEAGIPMLYVTHSVDELLRLADHVVMLDRGRVRASGALEQVLSGAGAPVLGDGEPGVLVKGRIAGRDARWHLARADFEGGSLWLRDAGHPVGSAVRLRVLARDVSLAVEEPTGTSILNHLQGRIESIADDTHPSQVLVRVRVGGASLLARVTRRSVDALGLAPGSAVWAQVKAVAVVQ